MHYLLFLGYLQSKTSVICQEPRSVEQDNISKREWITELSSLSKYRYIHNFVVIWRKAHLSTILQHSLQFLRELWQQIVVPSILGSIDKVMSTLLKITYLPLHITIPILWLEHIRLWNNHPNNKSFVLALLSFELHLYVIKRNELVILKFSLKSFISPDHCAFLNENLWELLSVDSFHCFKFFLLLKPLLKVLSLSCFFELLQSCIVLFLFLLVKFIHLCDCFLLVQSFI